MRKIQKNMKAQDLQNRIAMIKEYKLLAVSIHQNSYSDPAVKGPCGLFTKILRREETSACYPGKMNQQLGNPASRAAKGTGRTIC